MRLIFLLLLLPFVSFGRKFYFSSSTGSDSRTLAQAQNPATPWQTLKKLQALITNGNTTFLPGDTIAFKRGDTFANGYTAVDGFPYVSCAWINDPPNDYTAPSGTQANPIVLTNYGNSSDSLPNFYYPVAAIPTSASTHNVFHFSGVSWIIIDGLRFMDTRFPLADKSNPAYTRSCLILGITSKGNFLDTIANNSKIIKDCIVKNCVFDNVSFAVGALMGIRCTLTNNTITNLKTTTDTTGTYDVGSGAFEAINGLYNVISYNYVKGAWGKSGRISSSKGLLGVGVDVFNLRHSKIVYNTFIDCSGMVEIGNIDDVDTLSGAQNDTFAFNKVINCLQLAYIHGEPGSAFGGYVKNIRFFNNVVINNNKSRISGPNFGYDMYNDGQSFSGNNLGQYAWWFFRSANKCPNDALPDTDTTWSNPQNPPSCNYFGHKSGVQYPSDNFKGNPDTIADIRNNIFYVTNGTQIIYTNTRTKFKHTNNIYYIKGGFTNASAVGGQLNANEIVNTTEVFSDTSATYPEDWNLQPVDTSYAYGNGTYISSFSTDFAGNPINSAAPFIGLYAPIITPPPTPTGTLRVRKRFQSL